MTLKDGPIQIRYPDTIAISQQALYQVRTAISFSAASLLELNNTVELFKTDEANNRIQTLQTIGHEYSKTWLYANKMVFLQAQYWPLVWGSAGLLRPKLNTAKFILIDYVCPARPNSL